MLNVLLGATVDMVMFYGFIDTEASGVCFIPRNKISQWISSEITTTPLDAQMDANFFQFFRGPNPSSGIVGEHRNTSLQRRILRFSPVRQSISEATVRENQRIFNDPAAPSGNGCKNG